MSRLHALYREAGQSPWLDNIKRAWITSGNLERWIERGVRGLTSNPTIFKGAMTGTDIYDVDLEELSRQGQSTEACYWSLALDDIGNALDLLRPVYDDSGGADGFVSVEVDPNLAHDSEATVEAARLLHTSLDRPNLYVKIPGTLEGLPAIQQMISEGRNINVTLIFSLERYKQVVEAYLAGLESFAGDLSKVSSVASFFISRTDTEVDRRLENLTTPEALSLRGRAAIAQGQIAYETFQGLFSGERWETLRARGAQVQRPLWASTSTKNPNYPDTLYVDSLIGPNTINTLPESTLEAFIDHGQVVRTLDSGVEQAHADLDSISRLGIDLDDVARSLEIEGVAAFAKSFEELLSTLSEKIRCLS